MRDQPIVSKDTSRISEASASIRVHSCDGMGVNSAGELPCSYSATVAGEDVCVALMYLLVERRGMTMFCSQGNTVLEWR